MFRSSLSKDVAKQLRSLPGAGVTALESPIPVRSTDRGRAGADIITVQPEAGPHLHRTIELIKVQGKKAGVSLNPATAVEAVDPVTREN